MRPSLRRILNQPSRACPQFGKIAGHGIRGLVGQRDEGAAAVGFVFDPLKQPGLGHLANPAQRCGRRHPRSYAQQSDRNAGMFGARSGEIEQHVPGRIAEQIAGGPEKCAFVRDELGFHAVLDHRAPDFSEQLAAACPDGIDIYFENVGDHVWDAVLPLLNKLARVPVCGLISGYNDPTQALAGPALAAGLLREVLIRSLTIRGFLVSEFTHLQDQFRREASAWVAAGQLRYKEDIVPGLAKAPEAFIGLLEGRNFGKLIIRVAS